MMLWTAPPPARAHPAMVLALQGPPKEPW